MRCGATTGRRIVTASDDRTAVWAADGACPRAILRGHADGINYAAWRPDDQHIAATFNDGTVRVWRSDGSGEPVVLRGHTDRAVSVAWTPDGRRIVTTS